MIPLVLFNPEKRLRSIWLRQEGERRGSSDISLMAGVEPKGMARSCDGEGHVGYQEKVLPSLGSWLWNGLEESPQGSDISAVQEVSGQSSQTHDLIYGWSCVEPGNDPYGSVPAGDTLFLALFLFVCLFFPFCSVCFSPFSGWLGQKEGSSCLKTCCSPGWAPRDTEKGWSCENDEVSRGDRHAVLIFWLSLIQCSWNLSLLFLPRNRK